MIPIIFKDSDPSSEYDSKVKQYNARINSHRKMLSLLDVTLSCILALKTMFEVSLKLRSSNLGKYVDIVESSGENS